jgi:CheY-like chemotaxis protein
VTEKKRLEEQFLRVQRLESIGMLASGIAHDLNNVLAPIFLAAPMLRDNVTDPAQLRMITALERSAERGTGLVRQILSFAQGVGGPHQLVDVKHLLRDAVSVIRETFPKNIELRDNTAGAVWPVMANSTQIHQVLLNLCVNARDAMPTGGKLTLRAENCTLSDAEARAIEGARPGNWTVLHVGDTGTGIPPHVLSRIWEPFFTTKEAGKGTGLGLPTVRGIVENHQGFLTLSTQPGGTIFRAYFPADDVASGAGESGPTLEARALGNGELVLVVDDENLIRDMATTILSRNGYRAISAKDGAQALAMFAMHGEEISLVLTDLSMPNLDGASLVKVVHELNPAVKVLVMSGQNSSSRAAQMRSFSGGAFIAKPFKPQALLGSVNALLHPAAA